VTVQPGLLKLGWLLLVFALRWDLSVTVFKAMRGGLGETAISDISFGEEGRRFLVHGWKLKQR
jgi:hypothetical protein